MNVSEILQSNKVDSSPKMKIDMIRYSWILLRYTHIHAYKQNHAWALSCKGDNADLTWYDVLHGVSNISFSIDTKVAYNGIHKKYINQGLYGKMDTVIISKKIIKYSYNSK